MPVMYTIQGRLLRMDLVGNYAPQDVPRVFLAALDDPACPRPAALLLDVALSDSLAKHVPEEIRRVAEFLGPFSERIGGQVAVVATSNAHFGLSQMGAVFSEGVGVKARVFRNREDALQWLGLRGGATSAS